MAGVQNFNSKYFSFLNNESGISNRYIAKLESSFWYNATTYYLSDSINETNDSITLPETVSLDSFMEDMTGMRIDCTHTFPCLNSKDFHMQ